MTNALGVAYFVADDGVRGAELWRTDGSTAGTALVADVFPGPTSSRIGELTVAANGDVFFVADDGVVGTELWRTDGTGGRDRVGARHLARTIRIVAGRAHRIRRWRFAPRERRSSRGSSSGSPTGRRPAPAMVTDLVPGAGQLLPGWVHTLRGCPSTSRRSVRSAASSGARNGTAAGTVLVKDINPGPPASWPQRFAVSGGQLFFRALVGASGYELWKTDGTAAGTVLVRDVNPGTASSLPSELTDVVGHYCCSSRRTEARVRALAPATARRRERCASWTSSRDRRA